MLQAALVCSEGSHGASEVSITTVRAEQLRHTGGIADDLHERRLGLVSCGPMGRRGATQAGAATHLHTAERSFCPRALHCGSLGVSAAVPLTSRYMGPAARYDDFEAVVGCPGLWLLIAQIL